MSSMHACACVVCSLRDTSSGQLVLGRLVHSGSAGTGVCVIGEEEQGSQPDASHTAVLLRYSPVSLGDVEWRHWGRVGDGRAGC